MKKFKILYIIGVAAFAFGISGCSKDFLDQMPTDVISEEDLDKGVAQDPELLEASIRGLYGTMFELGTGGTDLDHDDFGQKGYDIYMDLMSSDMALMGVNYGWYRDVSRYTATVDYTNNATYKPWRYYYRIVFSANSVIDALGGTDTTPEDVDSRHHMGQAKAMRAYAYFYLANLYAPEGYGTGSEKILPIYTNAEDTENAPLSTSEEVYKLIIADLNEAIELLDDYNRGSTKTQINKNVAQGLLAYALAARGSNEDLEEAAEITQNLIDNSGHPLTSKNQVVAQLDDNDNLLNSEAGFNSVKTESWMWGADITLSNDLDLVSWWGQVDMFTYSYAAVGDPKGIDENLLSEIPDSDLRKDQFASDYTPINKFFTPERVVMGQRSIETDYIYMRIDEFYLLNAEVNARLGNDAAAKTSLKKLLTERFEDVSDISYVDNLNGEALKDEIYLQTRIELWGEGKIYLAMKRNKKSSTRGGNHVFHVGKTFQYNDKELSLVIPQQEVLNNPNL